MDFPNHHTVSHDGGYEGERPGDCGAVAAIVSATRVVDRVDRVNRVDSATQPC